MFTVFYTVSEIFVHFEHFYLKKRKKHGKKKKISNCIVQRDVIFLEYLKCIN